MGIHPFTRSTCRRKQGRFIFDLGKARRGGVTKMITTDHEKVWRLSHRADTEALPIADRHYNRQKIGSPQFVPPGRCLVLLADDESALWVTSYPFAQYRSEERRVG